MKNNLLKYLKRTKIKQLITILLCFVFLNVNAQAPHKMSYQAVIRNANNTLLSNQVVGVRISIIQGDSVGQAVYIETHTTRTNINGLMSLKIGGGLKFFGDFDLIDWSTGAYFVKTETDPEGGFNYNIIGISELLSVPYALYSGSRSDSANLIKRINTKLAITDTILMLAPYAKKANYVSKADLDSTNKFDINLQGNISASKNVTVKGNIEALGSTSTLGTIEKPFKGLFLSAGSLSIASDTLGKNIPAAVISNVEGNLQISAGGLKLLNDASFIARNIKGELEGNASTATALKTARKINGVYFDGTSDIIIDTTHDNFVKKEVLNGSVPFNINIDGNLFSSKNVTVAGNIEALGSTSTLGTISKPFKGLFLSSGSLSIASDTLGQNVPAAVLSNVTGNLQISAGGVKLMGENTSFIAPRIVGALTGNATTATKLETIRTINNIPFDGTANITIPGTDTSSLSNRINLKLNKTDTSAMLSARIARDTSFLSNRINLKMGLTGNQTLNGNLTLNNLQVNSKITFPDGSVQTSAPQILTTLYQDGGPDPREPKPLDLNVSVHKLADSYFLLKDGIEGQILYIVPNGRGASAEDIHIIVDHVRRWDRNQILELTNQDWQPFFPVSSSTLTTPAGLNTIVSAMFTDGAWNLTFGTLTPVR